MSTRLDAVAGALASRTVVVCPHCSHQHADVSSWNDYREGAWRDECRACGKAIYIRREIVVVYETSAEDIFDVDPPPSVPPVLPPPTSEVGVLAAAALLIANNGFVAGACAVAMDSKGNVVDPTDPAAKKFCFMANSTVSGAARAVLGGVKDGEGTERERLYLSAMDVFARYVGVSRVMDWDDVPGRTSDDVTAALLGAAVNILNPMAFAAVDAIRKARGAWDNWTDEDRAVELAAINSLGRWPSPTGGPGRGT